MGIETGVDYLQGLQENWPLSGEILSLGDDHLRLLKHVLLYTFPGFSRPIDSRLIPMSTLLDAEDARTVYSVLAQMEADVSYLQDIFLENGTTDVMLRSNNLSDLADVAAARSNLGVAATTAVLLKADNLSGIADPAAARIVLNTPSMGEALLVASNLGDLNDAAIARANLGVSATGDVALRANNLSDIANPAAARANLGVSATGDVLLRANDLSDLVNVALARGNLGVMSAAEVADAITAAVASVSSISDAPADGTYYARQDNLWVDIGSKIATDIATHSAAMDPHGDRAYVDAQLAIAEAGVAAALATKQDTLVSGTNIKTVNGVSILGSGNLTAGLNNFTEARDTTFPNNTVPLHSLAATGAETHIGVGVYPKGSGAFQLRVGGSKRGDYAVDLQISAAGGALSATGPYSAIGGGSNNQAQNNYSTVSAGYNNNASASYTFIGGGHTNTASGSHSAVVGGYANGANSTSYNFIGGGASNTCSGGYATLCGGSTNTASGNTSFVGGGSLNSAAGQESVVVGGQSNTASSLRSGVLTGRNNSVSGFYAGVVAGQHNSITAESAVAVAGNYAESRNNYGAAIVGMYSGQWAQKLFSKQTTDGTTTRMVDDWSASALYFLANNSVASATIQVVARDGTDDYSAWIEVLIRRGADAAATSIVGSPVVREIKSAGTTGWSAVAVADTTNGGLGINVTGASGKTIKWFATASVCERRNV